jgi:hypothetical protein
VAALIAPCIVEISGPVLLRPDLEPLVGGLPHFSVMKAAPGPTYLMFILRWMEGESADEIAYTKKRGIFYYQLSVDEVAILQIYRFGGQIPVRTPADRIIYRPWIMPRAKMGGTASNVVLGSAIVTSRGSCPGFWTVSPDG